MCFVDGVLGGLGSCSPLFAAFIDLCKAYDCNARGALFTAFVDELGVEPGTVAALRQMYEGVRA